MKKKRFFLFFCFAVLITSILSPLASNEYVRTGSVHDLVPHIGHVIQAKMALDQGQFPVRTAPWQDGDYGYAPFQFYGSIFYTITGSIYKFFTPQNPYVALKFFLWLSLLLGVIFLYKTVLLFIESDVVAFLTSIVYLMSPYLLINMFERGAIPEAVAQAFIPVVLYFSFKILFSKKFQLFDFIFASLAWVMISGTHLVTFVYFSFFFALFLLLFISTDRSYFKPVLFVGLPYLYGLLLGCFYLIPIGMFSKFLNAANSAHMGGFQFETLLPTLLSMYPTSPMPLPGNGRLDPNMKLYMSIGLPVLMAIGSTLYLLFVESKRLTAKIKPLVIGSLTIFFLAFFATWTPFDFWPYLPNVLQIAQFTWRLLTDTMWPSAFLFAFAIVNIFGEKLDIRHGVVGLILICVSLSPWITSQEVGSVTVNEILQKPDLGYGRNDYLVRPEFATIDPSLITMPIGLTYPNCSKKDGYTMCTLHVPNNGETIAQLPVTYYPDLLNVEIDGNQAQYESSLYFNYYNVVTLKLSQGTHVIKTHFQGLFLANWISGLAWFGVFLCLIGLFITQPKIMKLIRKHV